ncbi:MAG: hypothetical protein ACP6IP_08655 [Candidatus Njordarchaeia archaeon]
MKKSGKPKDIYDFMLKSMKNIQSKAWLLSRFDETEDGKVKPKITAKYFGVITLDQDYWLTFEGKFMRLKSIKLEIDLRDVVSVNVVMVNHLKIKWWDKREKVYHNALFQIGEQSKMLGLHPSKRAAGVWKSLIERAISELKQKELEKKRKKKR